MLLCANRQGPPPVDLPGLRKAFGGHERFRGLRHVGQRGRASSAGLGDLVEGKNNRIRPNGAVGVRRSAHERDLAHDRLARSGQPAQVDA
jgi:hypothetical protein